MRSAVIKMAEIDLRSGMGHSFTPKVDSGWGKCHSRGGEFHTLRDEIFIYIDGGDFYVSSDIGILCHGG